MSKETFTVEEIRNYITSQDSLGDVLYNLKAEKIIEANQPKEPEFKDEDEDNFQPCDNCDLPDACADFGCAIKNGVRKNHEW